MSKAPYNIIKQRISNRKNYLKHRAKRLAYMNAYHWKNREEILKKHAVYLRNRYWNESGYREKSLKANKENYRKNKAHFILKSLKKAKTFKQRARMKLQRAIRLGKIVRPEKCDECSIKCIPQGHHHKGYEKPLEVIWLCRKCHGFIHRVHY